MMRKVTFLLLLLALAACDKKTTQEDLCEGVICDNGGVCQNGDCQCPPQWTGPACQEEKTPVKMRVGSIVLTDFPITDSNGGSWDLSDGADVFIKITKGGTTIYESDYVLNKFAPLSFTPNVEFSDPTDSYTIGVWDYDSTSADDYLGGITFTPYQKGKKFPTSFAVNCSSCVVSFNFSSVTYYH